jgi:hypothetical protein
VVHVYRVGDAAVPPRPADGGQPEGS